MWIRSKGVEEWDWLIGKGNLVCLVKGHMRHSCISTFLSKITEVKGDILCNVNIEAWLKRACKTWLLLHTEDVIHFDREELTLDDILEDKTELH